MTAAFPQPTPNQVRSFRYYRVYAEKTQLLKSPSNFQKFDGLFYCFSGTGKTVGIHKKHEQCLPLEGELKRVESQNEL